MATLKTLVSFTGLDGSSSYAGLVIWTDASGNLFGTTSAGGANEGGTVFEIAKTSGGYASTPTILVNFDSINDANGAAPYGGLITDANGDLFGTTTAGGANGVGTVFEIVNLGTVYASTPTILFNFDSTNGANPYAGLVADSKGDLFGTTASGGTGTPGLGTVFEIVNNGSGYASTPVILANFSGSNGANPHGGLLIDAKGNLFGTTAGAGTNTDGTVFEIVNTGSSYATLTTLVTFNGADGSSPTSSLIEDANGDLFGTTFSGGGASGQGTVFEIVKTGTVYATTPTTLVTFNGSNGASPNGSLLIDANGDLFGTTSGGGANNLGTVFEIVKTGTVYAMTPTTLITFDGTNGSFPQANLIFDSAGNLFGTTLSGGANGAGTVFEITGVCFAAGTRIATSRGEVPVEDLSVGDSVLVLNDSAKPIRWIGRRRIDLTTHPRPEAVAPIRILRNAFDDNVPHTDLLLSPDHAIFVGGKLICARQLINGTTIRQASGGTAVEYFHIELDAHSILLAEGLPTESYLNTGNRGFFANSDAPLVLHPDLTDGADYPPRETGSCAPFVWDEASVRPVWQLLADRAAAIGLPVPQRGVTTEANLRLHTERHGRTSGRPVYADGNIAVFVLPHGAEEVRLVSRAQSPTEARPWLEDRRRLGVRVKRIVLRTPTEVHEIPMDHPDLTEGWWEIEREGQVMSRWTNGDAVVSLPGIDGRVMLEIHSAGQMIYAVERDPGEQTASRAA